MEARRRRAPVAETPRPRAVEPLLPPDKVAPPLGQVPTAVRVGNRPGLVETPFPPYGQLDVSGMASGSLARDPVSGKLFRVP